MAAGYKSIFFYAIIAPAALFLITSFTADSFQPRLPSHESSVKVTIHEIKNYGEQEGFARAAANKLEEVLNSPEFKAAVIAETFSSNNNLTPAQIHERIMKAHEEDGPGGLDGVVDLRLRTILLEQDGRRWMRNCRIGSRAGTIGIDGSGSGIAAICPQRLAFWSTQKDTAALTSHYAHEYMHILGFTHRNRKSTSVPYKIDAVVERLAKAGVER